MGYSYNGSVIILFEIRPFWDNTSEFLTHEFAKIRFYKSRREWNLYWMRANGKWQLYAPFPQSAYLDKMIEIIKEDEYSCIFG